MKLLTLNTWGGRYDLDGLLQFFKKHTDVDVFCLQEVWNGGEEFIRNNFPQEKFDIVSWNLLQRIAEVLPDYQYFFHPSCLDFYGVAIFIKKDILVESEGDVFIYKEHGYYSTHRVGEHARNLQYVNTNTPKGKLLVFNLHGLWVEQGKGDTPDRLEQSEKILNFLQGINAPLILCGDFNLSLETESIKMLEKSGLKNLVRDFGVTTTRTSLYTGKDPFADYIFVSKDVEVTDFQVLPDEVSDHSALLVEFEI